MTTEKGSERTHQEGRMQLNYTQATDNVATSNTEEKTPERKRREVVSRR
jgi:hypothetical protein